MLPLLRVAGHDAVAVNLPGADETAGLPEYTNVVFDAIDEPSDIVLAAHSLGGSTAPLVAAAAPLQELVLVNAMIPVLGETRGDWWGDTGTCEARVAAAQLAGYTTEFDQSTCFFHDVPGEVLAEGPGERPEADAVFGSVCAFDFWPSIPIRVVAGRDDRFFPWEFQRCVARNRLNLELDLLPGGHLIALCEPEALAAYLLNS